MPAKAGIVIPAKAGIQLLISCGRWPHPFWIWMPASAGMTEKHM
jgi:hypothetical protein